MRRILPIVLILALLLIFAKPEGKSSIIVVDDNNEEIIQPDFIYEHNDAVEFPAVIRGSGKKPVTAEYKGIEIIKLFASLGLDTEDIKKMTFSATDGYRVVLDIKEVTESDNVFLTFQMNGEQMKSKKRGGNGPFQLIIRKDPFSQRWIKHVEKIILE